MVGTKEKALTGYGHLVKMLPTGTVFLFQFLNPAFTNDGKCHVTNKYLTGALFVVCGVSCVLSCFTDSFTRDGVTHHGFATIKGIWTSTGCPPEDPTKYKIRLGDFVRAFLSLIVFAVVSLLDPNTINCFYPSSFEDTNNNVWIMALPIGVGTICSTAFVWFPDRRHGVGSS